MPPDLTGIMRRFRELADRVELSNVKHCSKCGDEHERKGQRYCKDCHAAYMREWRKTHPLTPDQRRKASSRSYAGVYKRRGHLVPQLCEVCGDLTEMHHDDYDKPLNVRWFCRDHHLALHRALA